MLQLLQNYSTDLKYIENIYSRLTPASWMPLSIHVTPTELFGAHAPRPGPASSTSLTWKGKKGEGRRGGRRGVTSLITRGVRDSVRLCAQLRSLIKWPFASL